MALQSIEIAACNEFLEYIRYSLAIEPLSYYWSLMLIVESNNMRITIEKEKEHFDFIAFDKEEIEFAVETIADYEFTKFSSLRQFGWCSSSKIVNSRIGHLEFSWLNQHKLFGKSDTITKCVCQLCLDRFDDLDDIVEESKK